MNLSKLLQVANDQKLRQDLSRLYFREGRVQASNLLVWIDMDSGLELDKVSLPATEFVKSYEIVDPESFKLKQEPTRVVLSDKNYSIKVPTISDEFPTKDRIDLDPKFLFKSSPLGILSKAAGFIGGDDRAPFTKNLYFINGICYALDYASIVAFDARGCFEDGAVFNFEIMRHGVQAVIGYGEEVISIIPTELGVYVLFDDGAWIFSSAGKAAAPDFRSKISTIEYDKLPPLPVGFNKAVADLDQLTMLSSTGKHELFFGEEGISTIEGEYFGNAKIGSWKDSCFNSQILRGLLDVGIERMDFSQYPQQIPFSNADCSVFGVFMGMAK